MPGGRPTIYTEELADRICEAIATSSVGLQRICDANPDFPGRTTILLWTYRHPEFLNKYMQARKNQAHSLMESTLEVANDDDADTLIKINRARLKVDVYKYASLKLDPATYGERLDHKVSVRDESERKIRDAEKQYKSE